MQIGVPHLSVGPASPSTQFPLECCGASAPTAGLARSYRFRTFLDRERPEAKIGLVVVESPPESSAQGVRTAITGGAGFIGSHLARRLRQSGAESVAVIDRRDTADGATPIDIAAASPDQLAAALKGVDWLFHLAAVKHNSQNKDADDMFRTNVIGTRKILDAAASARIRRVVFASSLYACGRMTGPPLTESETPIPSTLYGITKHAGEQLCTFYASRRNLPCIALRLFFVFGPPLSNPSAYPSVILANFHRIHQGLPPIIRGDGLQALDYIFIDDICDAMLSAARSSITTGVFNIGSGHAPSITELTETMRAIAAPAPEPIREPPDATAGTRRRADITRAREVLGWTPETTLDAGLRRTWDWICAQP